MYYTYISLYLLVMPHLPVPHIALAFLCSSKRPWGLLEAQYIPPMPLIIFFCRRPKACSCWEGVLLNRPLFSFFFHPSYFGHCTAHWSLCMSGKTLPCLRTPCHPWYFPFPWISTLWTPSPWSCCSGLNIHCPPLIHSSIPFPFLHYTYEIGPFDLFH